MAPGLLIMQGVYLEKVLGYLMLFALLILMVYSKYDDLKNWESFAESFGLHVSEVHSKYAYLQENGLSAD